MSDEPDVRPLQDALQHLIEPAQVVNPNLSSGQFAPQRAHSGVSIAGGPKAHPPARKDGPPARAS